MIGRERELTRLRARARRAAGGAGAVVAIAGEPGIGKSRLLRALEEDARSRGMLVLAGRTAEFERELPYGALVDALDQHLRTLDDTRLRGLDTEQLGGRLPRLRRPRRAADAGAGRRALPRAPRGARAARAARRHASRSCSRSTTCTTPTRPRPSCCSRSCAGRPRARVLVAIAMRSARIPPVAGRPARRRAARRRRGADRPRAARPRRGARADRHRRPRRAARGGAARERREPVLRRAARARGRVRRQPARDASRRRSAASCARSTRQARRLLEGAAVAGDPFEPDLAAAAAQLGEHDALELLDGLLEAGLVRETGVPRQFTFRHPLVRRAVYEGAGGGWRLAAHARVAAALGAARRRARAARPPRRVLRPARRRAGDRGPARRRRRRARADARDRGALVRRGAAAGGRAASASCAARCWRTSRARSPPPGGSRRAAACCWRRSCWRRSAPARSTSGSSPSAPPSSTGSAATRRRAGGCTPRSPSSATRLAGPLAARARLRRAVRARTSRPAPRWARGGAGRTRDRG